MASIALELWVNFHFSHLSKNNYESYPTKRERGYSSDERKPLDQNLPTI
jgi:hypothetical protein